MSNTYYSSLSGMLAASYGLQNTSNNIANMQSHGFKRSDAFFSSLGNGQGEEGMGHGVRVSGTRTNFNPGTYAPNMGDSDLAIVGHGFFVIKLKNNELVYTRDGNFNFDNGVLMDRKSGGQVQGYDSAGNLSAIHEQGPLTTPGKASRDIFLKGSFVAHPVDEEKNTDTSNSTSQGSTEKIKKYENVVITLDKIYDAQGKAHKVSFEFKNEPPFKDYPNPENYWMLEDVRCDDKDVDIDPYYYGQEIEFSGYNSGAELRKDSIQFGLNGKQVNLYFGTAHNGNSKSVQLETIANAVTDNKKTNIEIDYNDGYGVGKQSSWSFDAEGQLSYYYDNGQTVKGIHVGLARFDDMENNLIQTQDNFFRAKTNRGIHYGRPNNNGFECIRKNELENSNVDSTAEFANIVVLQRMFQACSQIMDIDKQLLEELESKS